MLYSYCINHANIDELRNYIVHQNELEDHLNELNRAKDNLLEYCKLMHIHKDHIYDEKIRIMSIRSEIRNIEEELEKKYEEFAPKPQLGCCQIKDDND